MTETKIPTRAEIPDQYKWNAESVFTTPADFDAALAELPGVLEGMAKFKDHLSDGPETLLAAYQKMDELVRRTYKLIVYASMSNAVDTTDQEASKRNNQAQSMAARVFASVAFFDPELLTIGKETLDQWLTKEAGLTEMQHYVDSLFRRQAHVRSAEVEELLGLVSDPFQNIFNTLNMLSNSDFKFAPAVASDGSTVQVTASTFDNLMNSPDRELRRTAYESYTDVYLGFRNALASNLATNVKSIVFQQRAPPLQVLPGSGFV